jgi:hypothetical protein
MFSRIGTHFIVALTCAGMLMPASVLRAGQPAISPAKVDDALAIQDVELGEGQSLHGIVRSEGGKPLARTTVTISQMGTEVARTETDAEGKFGFQGLRGGLHVLRAGEGAGLYRLWAEGTAPPHAKQDVAITDAVTIRGQRPFKELFTSNAFILTSIVVAAIAIPIAVHNARDDKSVS